MMYTITLRILLFWQKAFPNDFRAETVALSPLADQCRSEGLIPVIFLFVPSFPLDSLWLVDWSQGMADGGFFFFPRAEVFHKFPPF